MLRWKLVPTFALVLTLMAATFSTAMYPEPLPPGEEVAGSDAPASSSHASNGTGNDTGNGTRPPGNETQPPGNETPNGTLHPPELSPRYQSHEAERGETIRFPMSVRNPNNFSLPVTLRVRAPMNVSATISHAQVDLAPHEIRELHVTARAANGTSAAYVWIDAEARTGNASAVAFLKWRAPSSNTTLPAPWVTPRSQNVSGEYGDPLPFGVVVRNPANERQGINITLQLPLGWDGGLSETQFSLAPGESRVIHGALTSILPGKGTAHLVVRGRDASATAEVHACFSGGLVTCGSAGNGTGNETRSSSGAAHEEAAPAPLLAAHVRAGESSLAVAAWKPVV